MTMKSQSDIQKRLNRLRYNYLKRYLKEHLSPKPCNCKHNLLHTVAAEGGDTIRLCMLGSDDIENWPGNICDTEENARKCPFFVSKHDKDQLKENFVSEMHDPETLQREYKDVAILQWALGEDDHYQADLGWWERFRLWVGGMS